jgi:RNA polymerase sigma-70 factor (ECF subfamily)
MPDDLKELTLRFLAQRHLLLAFIQGLVRDRHAAEEILQEVWLQLAASTERGVTVEHPERWFRGVAKNLVLHHFRSKRTTRVVADSRLIDAAELAFEERAGVWQAERQQQLMECIDRLPEKSKDLLQLKYERGLRVADIASRLGRTEDAIMKTLSRIRQLLGECVEQTRLAEG